MTANRSAIAASAAAVTLISAVAIGSGAALATGDDDSQPSAPSSSTAQSIVAGGFESAPEGAVSLWAPSYNGFSCSASRIGANWVLTARHCAELNPTRAYTNSINKVQGEYANIVATKYAPNGDVALLKIDRNVAGKVLPYSAGLPADGATMMMRGWGMDSASGTSTNKLKGATGKFAGTGTNPYYGGKDLLINGVSGSPWKGDSGGPVTVDGTLYGALSWGSSYGNNPKAQAGYGALAPHAAWIQQTTGIAPNSNGGGSTGEPSSTNSSPRPQRTTNPPTNIPNRVAVTSSNYEQVLQYSYTRPLVLDFGATWCGACQQLKPRIEALNKADNGKWTLGEVDVDQNPTLTKQWKVTAFPTVVMIWRGKEIPSTRFVGAYPDSEIRRYLQTAQQHAANNPGPSSTTTQPPRPTDPSTTTQPPRPTDPSTTTEPTRPTDPSSTTEPTSTWTSNSDSPRPTGTTSPTATGTTPAPQGDELTTITKDNYNWFLEQSKGKTVFLDFSKDGCEPCAQLHPVIVAKAKQVGDKSVFGQIDGTKYPDIWAKYQNPWFPTVIAIRDGKEIARHTGYAGDAAEFNKWVDQGLQGAAQSDPLVLKADSRNWDTVKEMSWRHPVLVAYYRGDGKSCPVCTSNIDRLKKLVNQDGSKWTLVTVDVQSIYAYDVWRFFKVRYADTIDTYYRGENVQERLVGSKSESTLKAHIAKTLSTHYPPKDRP